MASQVPALPQSYTPRTDSVFSDQSAFHSLDSNVPGLSKVILNKLNLKDYGEYRFPIFIFSSFFSNVHNTQTALIGYALEICTNFTCPMCSKVALYVTLTPQILEHVSCLANDLVSDSNQGCTRREG